MFSPYSDTKWQHFIFWPTYILGSCALPFSFLLSYVPKPRGTDLTLDYASLFIAIALLAVSSYLGARLAKRKDGLTGSHGLGLFKFFAALFIMEMVIGLAMLVFAFF